VILDLLAEEQAVKRIEGRWYWSKSDYPAAGVNLRNMAGAVYTIQDESAEEKVIGTMDEFSALSQIHDHAVYLHAGETYFVEKLDLEAKIAQVTRRELDYYTQAVQASQIRVDEGQERAPFHGGEASFGDVTVTTTIPMFKKVRFHSRDSMGFEKLELPPQTLETVALWLTLPPALERAMKERRLGVGGALVGIANVMVEMAQVQVMCDVRDIGTVVDSSCLGRDALFLYDRYPGGMGYARRCLERVEEIMRAVRAVIGECGCVDGCPSCVGAAMPAFAMTDLDSATRDQVPRKEAAVFLLEAWLGPAGGAGGGPAAPGSPA
jgi:DEAD/DEAH box helicase domain-containing protein